MLKRVFFVRPLIVSVFFLLFVDVRAMQEVNNSEQEGDATFVEKQKFLRVNILEKGYEAEDFMDFLEQKGGKRGLDLNNWKMKELSGVVGEFQKRYQPVNQKNDIKQKENKFVNSYQGSEVISLFKDQEKDYNVEKKEDRHQPQNLFSSQHNIINTEGSQQIKSLENNYDNRVDNIQSNRSAFEFENESQDQKYFYELSKNEIASRFFCFYRYGGKFLTSLVWSVVNSYCGFEQLVMNDWYCFKYAMCSGYRLQPRFMRSRVWIDMNFNFLEGIAGFLIRFFLFKSSYNMYENIFDFFNVCIDIKVYNNLYLAVNVVGIVRSIVLLYILADKFINPFL